MSQPPGAIPVISVTEAAARLSDAAAGGPLLLDVREVDELVAARVEGAVHLPMSRFADGYQALPTDRSLLVMCAAGSRSAAATAFLLRSGWTDATNVEGGIIAWQRAGLPVRRGPIEPGEGEIAIR